MAITQLPRFSERRAVPETLPGCRSAGCNLLGEVEFPLIPPYSIYANAFVCLNLPCAHRLAER